MRENIADAVKLAQKAKDTHRLSTLRLIMAAIHERDIALRGKGKDKADETEILEILSRMVKQREESSKLYAQGGRKDLEQQELEEIEVIREFMPRTLNEEETISAIKEAIEETGAESLRDMGKVMAALKSRYTGQLDFTRASATVRAELQ